MLARERRQEPHVDLAEGVLVVEVLERDTPDDLAAHDQGNEQDAWPAPPRGDPAGRTPRRCRGVAVVDQQRLAGLVDVRCESRSMASTRWGSGPLARSCRRNGSSSAVELDADVDDLRVEDLLDPVADQVVHLLHVELGGKALLDAVDDRQLGRALVALFSSRFVSSNSLAFSSARSVAASVVSSRRSAVAECVRAINVLKRDPSKSIAGDHEGNRDQRFGGLATHR